MAVGLSGSAGADVQRHVLGEQDVVRDIALTRALLIVVKIALETVWKKSSATHNRVQVGLAVHF